MANKVYVARETALVFAPSGGDVTFTLTSLGAGAGRVSAQHDRGSGSHTGNYMWRFRTRAGTAPTVGHALTLYLVTGDGTYQDGDLGTSDAAISALDDLRNAQPIGTLVADAASTTKDFVRTGLIYTPARYLQLAVWNGLAVALSSTAGDHAVTLTPYADEVQ